MDEIPKYRKRKQQKSKSSKRSDHKHVYEKSILIHLSCFGDHAITGFYWTTHCSVCGRIGDLSINDDDFRRLEYVGRGRTWSAKMYLPKEEILAKFPNVPVYQTNPDDPFGPDIRVR